MLAVLLCSILVFLTPLGQSTATRYFCWGFLAPGKSMWYRKVVATLHNSTSFLSMLDRYISGVFVLTYEH